MEKSFKKILSGYHAFRKKYALGDESIMKSLSLHGQKPEAMVVACSDSRVDPALILQCDPGDLFVVRNVANIVPPYEKDEMHHGTSAALEFGICYLKVKHLIVLGHSQCGGVQAFLENTTLVGQDDFISNWVSLIKTDNNSIKEPDTYAKIALQKSLQNCLTFPWIQQRVAAGELIIHLWFFDIKTGQISTYSESNGKFNTLSQESS